MKRPAVLSPQTSLPNGTENVQFFAPYTQRLNYYSATIDWNVEPVDLIVATSYSSQRSFTQQDFTQRVGGSSAATTTSDVVT
jgi:hypothetical protein